MLVNAFDILLSDLCFIYVDSTMKKCIFVPYLRNVYACKKE